MESSQENLQAWESFQRDFEESKEKDKIEGTHSNKLQYYMYLGKDSCVAIRAGILTVIMSSGVGTVAAVASLAATLFRPQITIQIINSLVP